ncbi:MAG: hypothetical protein JNM56_33590 [Planctomycetia bacterium]|nr:hypothetical protein [Planctomycetia bacterium]
MRNLILWAGLFSLTCLVGGCGSSGPTPQDRHKQVIAALDEATAVLATVTDEASAQEAKPKLTAIGERIRELYKQGRIDKAGGMDFEQQRYDPKYAAELKELQAAHERFGQEKARVSAVPGGVQLVRTISIYVTPDFSR